MNELEILKLRFRCSKCKNLESHHASDKKRKCEKCGTNLTEITEKDYQHYKSKSKKTEEKEDKKEKKNLSKNKEEKKKNEETSEKDDTKKSRKLKKSSSLKNIEDKNYKLKKVKKEDDDEPKTSRKNSSKKDKKKKHRNRHKSIEKLAPRLSKVIKNILKGGPEFEKGIRRLNKIDFSEYSGSHDTNLIINHYDDRPTEVFLNDKRIKTDAFDSMFDCFGEIFNENFQNNFLQNFSSSNQSYFENVQNVVNNNRQHALKNGSTPTKDNILAKLKKFKLSDKYCKKAKGGKLELPNCCICLNEIKKGKETILLPCAHIFHYKCCLEWLKNNNTCPMCRYEIK